MQNFFLLKINTFWDDLRNFSNDPMIYSRIYNLK